MIQTYNIYCDESCHLEHDRQKAMVLGAIWCPAEISRDIAVQVREIKKKHGLSRFLEIKWTKVSKARLDFYLELVNFFFRRRELHFRALVVPDKSILDNGKFGQDHDTWYYKIYFDMLKTILSPEAHYRIYLDIKDSRSNEKIGKLHEVLCNNMYDFDRRIIEKMQNIRSHESEVLQLADLFIGAVSYVNRGIDTSQAKLAIVQEIKKLSHYKLTNSTLLWEEKVNICRLHGSSI